MRENANILTSVVSYNRCTLEKLSQRVFWRGGGLGWFACLFVGFGGFLFFCLLCMNVVLYVLCNMCYAECVLGVGNNAQSSSSKLKARNNCRLLKKVLGFPYLNHLVHY